MFDNIEYDIKFNASVFDAEECFIVFRYYYTHKDMYKHATIDRIYNEMGNQSYVFKSRKNICKKGHKKKW